MGLGSLILRRDGTPGDSARQRNHGGLRNSGVQINPLCAVGLRSASAHEPSRKPIFLR